MELCSDSPLLHMLPSSHEPLWLVALRLFLPSRSRCVAASRISEHRRANNDKLENLLVLVRAQFTWTKPPAWHARLVVVSSHVLITLSEHRGGVHPSPQDSSDRSLMPPKTCLRLQDGVASNALAFTSTNRSLATPHAFNRRFVQWHYSRDTTFFRRINLSTGRGATVTDLLLQVHTCAPCKDWYLLAHRPSPERLSSVQCKAEQNNRWT